MKKRWKTMLIAISTGMVMQVPGCTETAASIAATASVVTAGSVVYLVSRILD
ncbi:MAG: hypothetical protein AB7N71_00280 [Phycisphaerae bacterium]